MKFFFKLLISILIFASGGAQAAEISSDGSKLLVERRSVGNTICSTEVYDLNSGSMILSFSNRSEDSCGNHPSFSADSRYLATNHQQDIIVYDFKTKDIVYKKSSWLDVSTLRFSPDGKRLAIATKDLIEIEDFIAGKGIQNFLIERRPAYQIYSMNFISNQEVMVRNRFDRVFLSFNIESGKPVGLVRIDSSWPRVSADSQYVCTDGYVYNSISGELENLPRDDRNPSFSKNSKFLATESISNSKLMRVYQWPQLKEISRIHIETAERQKLISDDGKLLFTSGESYMTAWDVQTGQKLWHKYLSGVRDLLLRNSSTLVMVHSSGAVEVWDARTGVLKFKIK